jgi:ketosteroid isomerase-like protein
MPLDRLDSSSGLNSAERLTVIRDALVDFIETGSEDFIRMLSPDAVLWHNSDKLLVPATELIGGVQRFLSLVEDVKVDLVQEEQILSGLMLRQVVKGISITTGRPVAIHVCAILHVRKGQIERIDEYVDPTVEDQLVG